MNKTLLLILCDFLLLNILALTRWEKIDAPPPTPAPTVAQTNGNTPPAANELVEAMRQTLADEQQAKDQMRSQLETTAADLQQREKSITDLQQEKGALQKDLSGSQAEAQKLAQQAQQSAQEIEQNKLRLAQLQRDLELQERLAREKQQQFASLEQQHNQARSQIENLNVAVKVAEQEKGLLRENLESVRQEVNLVREEKQKLQEQAGVLAEGVGKLAESSGELTREIRENRPINPNTIFEDYRGNYVDVATTTKKKGLFAGPPLPKTARSILVSDGNAVFAVLHEKDSPFDVESPTQEYESIQGVLNHPPRQLPITGFAFHADDPRIVLVPISAKEASDLGVKVYQLAANPLKFDEAVLVSSRGDRFGEIRFLTDPEAPRYVRMDRNIFKRAAGQFSPTTGDLVLAQSGELLGVMVTNEYCLILTNLKSIGPVRTGTEASGLSTRDGLGAAYGVWRKLPLKLQ